MQSHNKENMMVTPNTKGPILKTKMTTNQSAITNINPYRRGLQLTHNQPHPQEKIIKHGVFVESQTFIGPQFNSNKNTLRQSQRNSCMNNNSLIRQNSGKIVNKKCEDRLKGSPIMLKHHYSNSELKKPSGSNRTNEIFYQVHFEDQKRGDSEVKLLQNKIFQIEKQKNHQNMMLSRENRILKQENMLYRQKLNKLQNMNLGNKNSSQKGDLIQDRELKRQFADINVELYQQNNKNLTKQLEEQKKKQQILKTQINNANQHSLKLQKELKQTKKYLKKCEDYEKLILVFQQDKIKSEQKIKINQEHINFLLRSIQTKVQKIQKFKLQKQQLITKQGHNVPTQQLAIQTDTFANQDTTKKYKQLVQTVMKLNDHLVPKK